MCKVIPESPTYRVNLDKTAEAVYDGTTPGMGIVNFWLRILPVV